MNIAATVLRASFLLLFRRFSYSFSLSLSLSCCPVQFFFSRFRSLLPRSPPFSSVHFYFRFAALFYIQCDLLATRRPTTKMMAAEWQRRLIFLIRLMKVIRTHTRKETNTRARHKRCQPAKAEDQCYCIVAGGRAATKVRPPIFFFCFKIRFTKKKLFVF